MDIQNETLRPGNRKAAARLAQGLTLVPYRAYNQRGQLTWYSRWVQLKPGETIAQAAVRLSVTPPQPPHTAQLQTKIQQIWREITGHKIYASSSSISAGTCVKES